jgi:hypothetical protein
MRGDAIKADRRSADAAGRAATALSVVSARSLFCPPMRSSAWRPYFAPSAIRRRLDERPIFDRQSGRIGGRARRFCHATPVRISRSCVHWRCPVVPTARRRRETPLPDGQPSTPRPRRRGASGAPPPTLCERQAERDRLRPDAGPADKQSRRLRAKIRPRRPRNSSREGSNRPHHLGKWPSETVLWGGPCNTGPNRAPKPSCAPRNTRRPSRSASKLRRRRPQTGPSRQRALDPGPLTMRAAQTLAGPGALQRRHDVPRGTALPEGGLDPGVAALRRGACRKNSRAAPKSQITRNPGRRPEERKRPSRRLARHQASCPAEPGPDQNLARAAAHSTEPGCQTGSRR